MKYLITILLIFSLLSWQAQRVPIHATIRTTYLSMEENADKNHPKQYWLPTQKSKTGGFECRWVENGDVYVKYNRTDTGDHLNRRDDLKKEYTDNVLDHIGSFKRFGIFSDPEQPPDFFYVFYIDPKKPNSLLMQLYSFAGYQVFSSNYFSDELGNPFEGLNLLKIDNKEHVFKVNR